MNTDDPAILPTFENRLIAHLHANGIDMAPGEYVVRQARCMRRLAGLGCDAETLRAAQAVLDRQRELLPGEVCLSRGAHRDEPKPHMTTPARRSGCRPTRRRRNRRRPAPARGRRIRCDGR